MLHADCLCYQKQIISLLHFTISGVIRTKIINLLHFTVCVICQLCFHNHNIQTLQSTFIVSYNHEQIKSQYIILNNVIKYIHCLSWQWTNQITMHLTIMIKVLLLYTTTMKKSRHNMFKYHYQSTFNVYHGQENYNHGQ